MTEQEYDDIIAPMLMDVVNKMKELGGGCSLVAKVEWEKGETGSTYYGDFSKVGITQYMAFMAARCDGNIDEMLMALIKDKDVSASMFLAKYNEVRT